ncbi:DUF305 domain-containing protein [Komarekiella sp. 'clone 1']|uniref:DUF305 domain-containing protein n=1 Tax=Komarekiella delphini-convector SJRDD-AB1 TaxID=2593771 RepID=A0AA40SUE5_9NOST|nr:DUF305 domain-containing protein [Komarekiella delphini-convector]MBD6615453.1 DUF305 domain-containing protein [Komarekiella delphini-convector SJRDD-AB1]
MNKKVLTYSLVTLLTGTTITAFSTIDSAKANDRNQVEAPNRTNTSPMHGGMNMRAEVDKSFIEMMIPHHQSANEMAQMALSRAKSPEVKKLAQSIISDQTREIQQMQTWYKQWYGKEVPMSGMNMGNGMDEAMKISMQQQEMMDREMMTALQNAPNFDQEFLRQMTRHHQMATMMAGMVGNSARHPEIRNLAQSIAKSQSAEIAQMQQLLQAMNTTNQNTLNRSSS